MEDRLGNPLNSGAVGLPTDWSVVLTLPRDQYGLILRQKTPRKSQLIVALQVMKNIASRFVGLQCKYWGDTTLAFFPVKRRTSISLQRAPMPRYASHATRY